MKGIERFKNYLLKWESLAEKAASAKDIAVFILENDGRTVFFMLEALTKIYKNLHDEKMFSKYNERFKDIEDKLGEMDHYRECIDEFSKQGNEAEEIAGYFRDKYARSALQLNNLLAEDDWLNGKRVKKIIGKLEEAEWKKEEKEMELVKKYYDNEIAEFKTLYNKTGSMRLIEDHLHEFRRRLRWFSIYPHAMQGAIQLDDVSKTSSLEKYHSPEIVSSPFNQFPAPGNQQYVLFLEKSNFLALSWMIDALGKLKDRGLLEENRVQAFKDMDLPYEVSGIKASEDNILEEANSIMQKFMQEGVLDNLVDGVRKL